jgi:hypothetical protein
MTNGPHASAAPSSSGLTPEEIALRDALARKVDLGSAMTVMPVRQADVGNRVLEATRQLLDDRGLLVVVIDGGSDKAVQAAWSLTASARFEASKRGIFSPIVLIAKDAHLLPPGKLDLLARVGDLAIVAAPVVMLAAPQKMALRRCLRIASILVGPVVASLAIGVSLWPAAQRGALEMAATQLFAGKGTDAPGSRGKADPAFPSGPATDAAASVIATPTAPPAVAPSAETAAPFVPPPPSAPAPASPAIAPTAAEFGAPGLLLKARSGDTLETLYQRIYRGVTPPSFATVAALNPEDIRPGVILLFPAPVNGWARQDDAEAEPGIR